MLAIVDDFCLVSLAVYRCDLGAWMSSIPAPGEKNERRHRCVNRPYSDHAGVSTGSLSGAVIYEGMVRYPLSSREEGGGGLVSVVRS